MGNVRQSGLCPTSLKVLEVGYGTGANLRFAAREGFEVAGIEISEEAVAVAQSSFAKEGLVGDLQQGCFTELPFKSEYFDLIIDRAALTCVSLKEIEAAVSEIARVSKPNAKFLFNCYSDTHSSARSGTASQGRVRKGISQGSLAGMDHIAFLSANDIYEIFSNNWELESMKRMEILDLVIPDVQIHSEWRVVAIKL
tara:strand:+ start:4408 stop:4998 length:591 start_codon:yes stop_codon:yes gene_type:complete